MQVWDVSCERLVEIYGSDASRLIQMLTPRDLSDMPIGKCLYTPMVDEMGGMLNDPVSLRLADNRYWISLADSDLLLSYALRDRNDILIVSTALQITITDCEARAGNCPNTRYSHPATGPNG